MTGGVLYDITSAWPGKAEPPEVVGEKFLRVLDSLTQIEPSFHGWETSDDFTGEGSVLVESRRRDFGAFVERNGFPDGRGGRLPEDGYWLWAVSGGSPNAQPLERRASFMVRAGGPLKNFGVFEIGSEYGPPDASLVTYARFKAVLLTMLGVWPAPWANVRCRINGRQPPTLPGEPFFPHSDYKMPWTSYLDAERSAKVEPPSGVLTERTPDGGLLMIAAETRFDPTDVYHMRLSRLIARIMIAHGGDPDR